MAQSPNIVPVIDLSDPEDAVVARLREACIQYGFFYVSNHGVAAESIAATFEASRAFFGLPTAQKLNSVANGLLRQRFDPSTACLVSYPLTPYTDCTFVCTGCVCTAVCRHWPRIHPAHGGNVRPCTAEHG